MSPVDVLDIVNYGLVFVYGLFLSACSFAKKPQKNFK